MKSTHIKTLLIALALQIAVVANAAVQPSFFKRVNQAQMNEWVEQQLNSLTLRDRVAQLFVICVPATDDAATRKRIDKFVGEYHVGGLIYDHGDIMGQASLNNYAQSIANVPLLITYDGEWGLAMRLKDAPTFPRNMILGAITNDKLLYEYGREVAREMRRIGVHVNFAPDLDTNDNPNNPVIGTRSFGEIPERGAALGIAYSKGLEDGGVISVSKHFPGHGSTSEDSHKTLPLNSKSMRELNLCELVPFTSYINAGLSGVMVGHMNVPSLDNSGVPTSLSKNCITGLLRNKLGFQGLIFTDALEMEGAQISGHNCIDALLAGNDVLLMPRNTEKQIEAIVAAVSNGTISTAAIDERCRKMLRYKFAAGLGDSAQTVINTAGLVKEINAPDAQNVINKLWAGSITVAKNKSEILPLKHLEKNKIAVVSLGDNEKSMFARRCAMYAPVDFYNVTSKNVNETLELLKIGEYSTVVLAVMAHNTQNVSLAALISSKAQNVVSVLFAPAYKVTEYVSTVKASKGVVLGYDNCSASQDYAAQTIFGGNAAQGIAPVTIKGVIKAGSGIKYPAFRLGYASPQEVGIKADILALSDSLIRIGLEDRAFSGCQLLIARHGKIFCNKFYGVTNYKTKTPIDVNTVFDLASVSKATGTLSAVMKAYDAGHFNIDDTASKWIDGLVGTNKEDVTFRELLFHETGIQPSLNMFNFSFNPTGFKGQLTTNKKTRQNTIKVYNGTFGNKGARLRTDILSKTATDRLSTKLAEGLWGGKDTYDSVMVAIYQSPLRANKKYCYSCLNFCLLADATQRMNGLWQDEFLEKNFWAPLGASHICYRPTERFAKKHIAATEYDAFLRRQLVHGFVHDELAAISGGVQGNAGLFGSANDLAKLFQMWLNGGVYGGVRYLKKETVNLFTTTKSPNSHRGLGFDKPIVERPRSSSCCEEAPASVYGHTGFTGTCFWIDPTNDVIFIFLSNRVHTTRDNRNWTQLNIRDQLQSLIYSNLVNP